MYETTLRLNSINQWIFLPINHTIVKKIPFYGSVHTQKKSIYARELSLRRVDKAVALQRYVSD